MKNEIIEVNGRRWKVKEALSLEDALSAINMARSSGAIGGKKIVSDGESETVVADVIQINSDNTERIPYTELY